MINGIKETKAYINNLNNLLVNIDLEYCSPPFSIEQKIPYPEMKKNIETHSCPKIPLNKLKGYEPIPE